VTDKSDNPGPSGTQSEQTQGPEQVIIVELSPGPDAPQTPIGTGGWGHGTVAGVMGPNPVIADWGHAEIREAPTVSEPTATSQEADAGGES
jgi:hypothetical protein